MQRLDPLAIPLTGLGLIEASAGTGKTYTIATLYLRLLLELGLEVDRILVVTYTKAATEELRERIRTRVAQALDWLRSGDPVRQRGQDPVLAELLARLPDPELAQSQLTDALTRMDEAAIHTIHAFCQRTLQEQAFESGAAFESEFITDEKALRRTAVQDVWRARVSLAAKDEAAWIRQHWRDPQTLLQELAPTLPLDDLRLTPEVDDRALADARRALDDCFDRLRALWTAEKSAISALLQESPALNRKSYNKNIVARALSAAGQVATADRPPSELPKDFTRLTNGELSKATKSGSAPPSHAFFDLCSDYAERLPAYDGLRVAHFLACAREQVRAHLERRKQDECILYFDDLLRRLDRALQGEGAEALASVMRARHPVALIDEFQDTDPQQYRIFRRVYQVRSEPGCALFLIGDPKQAIYAFRGADIFTYMQARADAARAGNQFTLGVNWRSGTRLVQALNALFGGAERPFIYEPQIQYLAVDPSPSADTETLTLDGQEPAPLQFWQIRLSADNQTKKPPGYIRREKAQESAALACAERIAELLNGADAGRVTLGDRPVLPKDIAILVRTHREGDLVQQSLRARGVRSVSLSQDSVFTSEDADELATLLAALAEHNDEGLLRAALATSLIGSSAAELDRLSADELAWERLLARFQLYRERWLERGFMVAFQSILVEEGIAPRLLRRPDGERRLTNLLQLAELLQVASREHPGIDGLLRWFADQRAEDAQDEERQLRLESDEGLVKVVTMHKSKGLEYPLVFIPFPWSFYQPRKERSLARYHDLNDLGACLDLGSTELEAHRRLERTESLAERLRLFYVAVTRAAKLCVLCWGRIKGVEDSAMAYLLHPKPDSETPGSRMATLSETEILADLQSVAARAPGCIEVRELPEPSGVVWSGTAAPAGDLTAAVFSGRIDTRWRVSSYSSLIRGEESERPDYDALPTRIEHLEISEETPSETPDPLFDLPSGTRTGRLLHALFEQLDFHQASGEYLEQQVTDLLARYDQLRGSGDPAAESDGDWTPTLVRLVTNVLDTELDRASGLRLRDIGPADRLTELEFHFPLSDLDPAGLRALLGRFADYRHTASGLTFEPLRGLMRGFIDLCVRRDGRYYILDYKSNRLGGRLSDYGADGMRREVRRHRYDLQYLIYSLALHRFLGQRLPGYDYARHFGGVFYLFLRGLRPEIGPDLGVWHARPPLELIQGLDRLFGTRQEVA